MATSMNNIKYKVDSIMKSCINNAKRSIADQLEAELKKTDNTELKEALSLKSSEVWTSVLILKPRSTFPVRKEPVRVKDTPLYLKNVSNAAFKKLCELIAELLECNPDFSDSMFRNMPQNSRVYEAIRRLHASGKIHQELLDELTAKAEDITKNN